MKKIAATLVLLLALILVARPAGAQSEKCSLGAVSVVNDVAADGKAHSKTTFSFSCGNTTNEFGQMTKIVYSIPLTDVSNFEATDDLGTMKVLEGPAYATSTAGTKESVLGVIFRKPLLITDRETSYTITAEFDSSALVVVGENGTFSISPGKQIANPKVTIITAGITEVTYPIGQVNYELNLPSDVSVQTLTAGCTLGGGKIRCQNLAPSAFNSLEIRWSKPAGAGGLFNKIRQNLGDLLPGLTNVFKGIGSSLSKLVKGK